MFLKVLIVTIALSYQVCTRSIMNENVNSSKCLRNLTQYIFKNNDFEVNYEYLSSITTITDYVVYLKTFHANISRNMIISDHRLIFDLHRFDRKFLLLRENITKDFNPEILMLEGWLKRRAKIGILRFETSDVTLITNLNLEVSNVCSKKYFYEIHANYCTSPVITRHYLMGSNFKKLCKVRVAWVRSSPFVENVHRKNNPGIMVSFFNIYGEKQNVEVVFQKDNTIYEHEFLNNGTFFKMGEDLLKGEYDAAVGPLFMNTTDTVPFDYGALVFKDDYYFTVKKREKITNYQKLTIVFKVDVWKGFLITFLLVSFLYFLLNLALEQHSLDFVTAVFDIFNLSLSGGVSILPQSISLRLLLIFYSLFSINIDSAYLGTLSQIFTNAPYTVMELKLSKLLREGLMVNFNWFVERLAKIRFVARRNYLPFLSGHMLTNDSDEELLKRVAYNQQNLTFTLRSTLVSHPYEASLVDYYDTSTSYLTLFVTFYIRKDFHLKNSLQFWSYEVFEKGFFSKWMNDIIEQNRNGSYVARDKKEAIALKFQHFEDIFKMLVFGYTLAALALMLEFVYVWIDRRFAVTEKIAFLFSLLKPPVNN